jgi:hypothetical protein
MHIVGKWYVNDDAEASYEARSVNTLGFMSGPALRVELGLNVEGELELEI